MNMSTLNQTFSALSDPSRRDLLLRLADRPQTAGSLAEPYDLSRPAISRHLRVLREANLVTVDKKGREQWYTLNPEAIEDAQQWLDEVQHVWTTALQSLKDYVEGQS